MRHTEESADAGRLAVKQPAVTGCVSAVASRTDLRSSEGDQAWRRLTRENLSPGKCRIICRGFY